LANKDIQAFLDAWISTLCDKCGKEVKKGNDAKLINVLVNIEEVGMGETLVSSLPSRHLLSVEGCEGTPSRAQYLKGQPRDTRSEFVSQFSPEFGEKVRRAYKLIKNL
jgi:hypothetical protein